MERASRADARDGLPLVPAPAYHLRRSR